RKTKGFRRCHHYCYHSHCCHGSAWCLWCCCCCCCCCCLSGERVSPRQASAADVRKSVYTRENKEIWAGAAKTLNEKESSRRVTWMSSLSTLFRAPRCHCYYR
ncbi:unnamed protein product, partial [Ectocarpus sp. 13 AM-2016]